MASPKVQNWELILTHVSQFEVSASLHEIAESLAKSGACPVTFCSDGSYWHNEDGSVVKSRVKLETRPKLKHGRISFKPLCDEYAENCLFFATEIAFVESQTLSSESQAESEYVRAFFEPIFVEESGVLTSLYPYSKIYKNGVCILSLRIFSGSSSHTISDIAEKFVGLGSRYFDDTLIPESILRVTPSEDLIESILDLHPELFGLNAEEFAKAIIGEKIAIMDGDVERVYHRTRLKESNGFAMLDVIWSILSGVIDDLAFRPSRFSVRSLLKRSMTYQRHWFCHPILFLIKWRSQPASASNFGSFEPHIARIIAGSRSPLSSMEQVVQTIPRLFDDYKIYLTQGLTVYALSSKCWKGADPQDSSYQRTSTPMIANEEFALWLISTYRGIERKSRIAKTPSECRRARRDLQTMELLMDSVTNYGELEVFFSEYLNRFSVLKIVNRSLLFVERAENLIKDKVAFRATYFSIVLSVLFGIVGSGQIAEGVIKPLRESGVKVPTFFSLPNGASDFLLATIFLGGLCIAAWTLVHYKSSKEN